MESVNLSGANQILEQLAEILKVSVDVVPEVLIRQAYLEAVFVLTLSLSVLIASMYGVKHSLRKLEEADHYEHAIYEALALFSGVCVLMAYVFTVCGIFDLMTVTMNPRYVVIDAVRKLF